MLNVSKYYFPKNFFNSPFASDLSNIFHNDFLKYEVFHETLIDHFLDILDRDIIFQENNYDKIIQLISQFCKKENIKVRFLEGSSFSGYIENDNIITIFYPVDDNRFNKKELIYVFLHELSHYITIKSSGKKVKDFYNEPNTSGVDITNLNSVEKELKYYLMPNESANWAFTFSLVLFEETNIMASDFYKQVKNDFLSLPDILFYESQYYKNLSNFLKSFYKIIAYVLIMKKYCKQKSRKYNTRLMKFISLTDKYLKRLNNNFSRERR